VKVIKTDGSSYTTEVVVQSSPVSQTYYTKEESLGSTILDYIKAGGYIKEVGVLATGSGWNCIFAAYVDYIYVTYKLSP